MSKKIKLEFTRVQLHDLLDMIGSIESMLGCADTDNEGNNWDLQMQKRIKSIDRMLKRNNLKRV